MAIPTEDPPVLWIRRVSNDHFMVSEFFPLLSREHVALETSKVMGVPHFFNTMVARDAAGYISLALKAPN